MSNNCNSKQPGNNQEGKGTKRNQRGRVKQVIYTNQVPPGYLQTAEDNNEEKGFQYGLETNLKTNIDSDILDTRKTK